MRIWIDGFEANVPQRLGSGQVAIELLRNLEQLDTKNDYTILLASPPLEDLPIERPRWRYKIVRPNKFKTFLALPLVIHTSKQKPDIFFSPTHYIPRFAPNIKKVMMIFDLAYLHFPQMFKRRDLVQLTNWTRYSIKNSNHIITISNFSKKDILKNYSIPKGKITVTYPGFNEKVFKKITNQEKKLAVLEKYKIEGNYIVYLGTLQPRKNLVRLIEAVSRIDDINLVIIGKTTGLGREGWMYEEILDAPRKFGCEDRVIFTGFMPTEEIPYLFTGSLGFIQPSLWEGFGIPVVEAMATGTPVLVSNVSSLPEVVGNAGLTFNPQSIDQIEQAIRTIATDKKLREKKIKLGFERSKKFSWKKMARTVIEVFEDLKS